MTTDYPEADVPEEGEEQPELTEEELPSQDPEGRDDFDYDAEAAAEEEGEDQ